MYGNDTVEKNMNFDIITINLGDSMKKEIERLLPYVQKPGRYIGKELNSVVKDKNNIDLRYAFCFPDSYEIGMSHLGIKILYSLINARSDAWCERVFAPWTDMEDLMRMHSIPLFALESGDYIKDFDAIGFTLQYEMSYTNVVNMIDLAGLPIRSKDRHSLTPVIMIGGPCACNSEPIADFVDIVQFGEGEEMMNDILDLLKECKKLGASKEEFLTRAAQIDGIYVPSLYTAEYNEDGTFKALIPHNGAPAKIKKRVVKNLDTMFYPESFVVPYLDAVFDRASVELFRGCIRGCRFCQAGFIYRPIREKSYEVLDKQCKSLCDTSGYDEISLCSLSSSDYTQLTDLLYSLLGWTTDRKISIELPSLRIDNFPQELMEKLNEVRRSGLTFAPEAGTQRLRDVINKNITEENILSTVRRTFASGYTAVKLYFMIGLPTETNDDIKGIADLAQAVVDEYYRNPNKPKGKSVQVSASVASFVPKPFTPFQWERQFTMDELLEKQAYLKSCVTTRKVSVSCHTSQVSFLEGVFARGDRRLSDVIESAWKNGCKFDSWNEYFDYDKWMNAFEINGIDPYFYTARKRSYDEAFPWDHMDVGVRKEFLIKENMRAYEGITTPNCREKCSACGAAKLNGGHCDAISSTAINSQLI